MVVKDFYRKATVTHSALTNKIRLSPQSSSRQGATIDTFLIHHTASVSGRGDGIVNMMVNRTRQVSSNYVIGNDGYLWMVVDEDLRAWTSGSTKDGGKGAAWDRRSITVEIVNEAGAPNWPLSAKAVDKAARLLIDLRRRYRIRNVLGHRDLWLQHRASYPTFCPGPDSVQRILNREREILGGAPVPPASPWADVRAVQTRLNLWLAHWGVTPLLVVDGDYGPKTRGAATLAQQKFGIAVDGVVGPQTWGKISADPPPAKPAWQLIAPVQKFTHERAVVLDPFTKTVKGHVEPGVSLAIASKVEVDGVTYLRTDWSTRQGNDSGIVASSLHAAPASIPKPPEPAPEPAPTPEPEPEPPAIVTPPAPEPEPPVVIVPVEPTPEQGPPLQHAKPASGSIGWIAGISTLVLAAIATIIGFLNG